MTAFTIILLAMLASGASAQCPPLYEMVGDRCFLFFTDLFVGYEEAEDTCQDYNGTLARLDECQLLSELSSFYEESGLPTGIWYWIDATDADGEGSYVWSDGTSVSMGAPFWAPPNEEIYSFEPQDDGDNCVALDYLDGFYFHNDNCLSVHSSLCQYSDTDGGDCPSPYESVAGGCYSFSDGLVGDWEAGIDSCKTTGGHLAYIDDCSEMSLLIDYIEQFDASSNVWIGGERVNGVWEWTDGSIMPMGTPFWGTDQADGLQPDGIGTQNCALAKTDVGFHFADDVCSSENTPLCEADLL